MASDSKIAWTDDTFNPWHGCTKVDAECDRCYAETVDARFNDDTHWGKDAPRRFFGEKHWNSPLRWNKEAAASGRRRLVFCASMADVFEVYQGPTVVDGELKHRPLADALDPWRLKLWGLIKSTPALTWLVLTKRPQNIGRMLPDELKGAPNLWLGTTVGKPGSLWRAERLIMEAPWAEVRFLSMEPLLERTSLHEYHTSGYSCSSLLDHIETGDGDQLPGIDWVIAGSESGDGARPMNTDWARLLRDECKNYGRAFFLKQADFGQEGISSFDGGPHPSYKKRDLRTSSDGMRRAHLIIEQPALDGIQHVNWPKEE